MWHYTCVRAKPRKDTKPVQVYVQHKSLLDSKWSQSYICMTTLRYLGIQHGSVFFWELSMWVSLRAGTWCDNHIAYKTKIPTEVGNISLWGGRESWMAAQSLELLSLNMQIFSLFFLVVPLLSFSMGPVVQAVGFSCWQDEDFVGRVSRVTRRTHAFTTCLRSFTRILMAYKRLFKV